MNPFKVKKWFKILGNNNWSLVIIGLYVFLLFEQQSGSALWIRGKCPSWEHQWRNHVCFSHPRRKRLFLHPTTPNPTHLNVPSSWSPPIWSSPSRPSSTGFTITAPGSSAVTVLLRTRLISWFRLRTVTSLDLTAWMLHMLWCITRRWLDVMSPHRHHSSGMILISYIWVPHRKLSTGV